MSPRKLIWKELRQRPISAATCLLAISLGVGALVAIRTITVFSEDAVAQQLESLGANVLLLPQAVTLEDYYAADAHGKTLPESHATRLVLANLEGVESVSPKLCVPAEVEGREVTLTGILPQSEFQTKAAWQGAQLLGRKHAGCKKHAAAIDEGGDVASGRIVQDLADNEAIVGADVALAADLKPGDHLMLLGERFEVSAVLPVTGTVDDGRVFAHLHTVQRLAGAGEVVNAIEIMACCEDAAGGLIGRLGEMFRDAKVLTIAHVVETQVSVNRLMSRLSLVFVGILVVVGAAGIAGTMFANVAERRREIGTLMALGATPSLLARLFLTKAILIGSAGGILGFVGGTGVAVAVGPHWAGVVVEPLPSLAAAAVALAGGMALMASFLPAHRAAHTDPCLCFREV